ncbi:MAG: MFS transporter [Rhodospirillaceae bacterium]|nr:MFS transporter [Rhodospirillaceae bacterium]
MKTIRFGCATGGLIELLETKQFVNQPTIINLVGQLIETDGSHPVRLRHWEYGKIFDDTRIIAFDLILSVYQDRRSFDDAQARHRGLAALDARDRNFVRLLANTVFRRAGELDAIIQPMLRKRLRGKAAPVRYILWLGAAQLLYLKTPPHAAVQTAVAVADATGFKAFKGLINAVLRGISRETPAPAENPGKLNTAAWLWKCWVDVYGEAEAGRIAEAHLIEAPLDIAVKSDAALWAERLDAEVLPTGALRRPAGGDVRELPGFEDGAWWVQDAAAQLPATLMGDLAGKTVVDLCAAPGGKSAQLAAAGARTIALDSSATRLKRLEENMMRLDLDVEVNAGDAGAWRPRFPVDMVLLDAPCTATGAARRHPDILRLKTERDPPSLAAEQARLLRHALDIVEPGGTVLYATCSLQPEEGLAQIDALLESGAPAVRDPIGVDELPGLPEAVTIEGDVRTLPSYWPDRGGMDGFFIARLRRTESSSS